LFFLGVVVRVYGAWSLRWFEDPDGGVVALMAKHMAEGGPLPVFFYGQHYMGSLEPMVSALLCRLFGVSGFMVSLGTALCAVGVLVLAGIWAWEAAGPEAGVAALALCVVGPRIFFFFSHTPRGGYMVALALGLAVMVLADRMARSCWKRKPVAPVRWLLLGVAAGLGWWSNPLISPALAAAALVLLMGLRGRFWTVGVATGLAGFLGGSAPFWIYNLRHDWVSLRMAAHVGDVPLGEGLVEFGVRLDQFLGLPEAWPVGLRLLLLALYGLLVLAATGLALARVRRGFNPALVQAFLFVLLSLLIYLRSSYVLMNTGRYLVPLVPAFGLFAGYLLARSPGRWKRGVWGLVLLLVGTQLPVLR